MKIKRRIRLFFSCFRPRDDVVEYDYDGIGAVKKRQCKEGKAGGMVVSGYGGKEESMVTLPSFSDDEINNKKKKEKSIRRSVSHVLDSIFSETSLSKKSGSRKSTDNSFRSTSSKSSSSSSSKFARIFKSMKRKATSRKSSSDTEEDVTRSNSSGSSSLFSSSAIGSASFSSSSTSSFASSSRSASERRKPTSIDLKQVNNNDNNNNNYNNKSLDQAVAGGSSCYFSSNVGFCCLLIFVLVLMTWGKVFAIFCTCLCLLSAPTQFKAAHPRLNDVEMVDTDTEEYKKRVVMEGLLERKVFRKSFSSLC